MEIPALSSGYQGIQSGMDSLRNNASNIASNVGNNSAQAAQMANPAAADSGQRAGPADSLVNLRNDMRQVEASAQVVKAADETLGTLLDERA